MTGPTQPACFPFFLESAGHHLFSLACSPNSDKPLHGILVCPPFAEEMNRCRRSVRVLCEALARKGMPALSTDLRGTGDSTGDFGDASWDAWLEDLGVAANWLHRQGCTSLSLVGIRAGALLAWELLRREPPPVRNLVLWQPILTGKAVVTDILRARVAAAAAQGRRETVVQLRQQLEAGETIESAGYSLGPGLAAALDRVAITADITSRLPAIYWIEIGSDEGGAIRQVATQLIQDLGSIGAPVELTRQPDPPFWSTTEVTVGRRTVEATVNRLAGSA